MLAERFDVEADMAFERLRREVRNRRMKLRALAAAVIAREPLIEPIFRQLLHANRPLDLRPKEDSQWQRPLRNLWYVAPGDMWAARKENADGKGSWQPRRGSWRAHDGNTRRDEMGAADNRVLGDDGPYRLDPDRRSDLRHARRPARVAPGDDHRCPLHRQSGHREGGQLPLPSTEAPPLLACLAAAVVAFCTDGSMTLPRRSSNRQRRNQRHAA